MTKKEIKEKLRALFIRDVYENKSLLSQEYLDLFDIAIIEAFDENPEKVDAFLDDIRAEYENKDTAQDAIVQSILEIADTLEEDKKEKIKDILNSVNM